MRRVIRFVTALGAILTSCGPNAPDGSSSSSAPAPAAAAPIPRPAAVAAHLVVQDVAGLHETLKTDSRLGAYLVGRSWAASAVSWAGLPITAAEHVETSGQLRGAVALRPGGVGWAIAIPLHNPGALLAVVTAGDGTRFRRKPQSGFDELVLAKEDDGRFRAIAGGFLVVAGTALDLGELAAFLSQPGGLPMPNASEIEREAPPLARAVVDRALLERLVGPVIAAIGPMSASTGWQLPVTWSGEVPLRIDKSGARIALSAGLGRVDGAVDTGPLSRILELPAGTDVGLALFLGEASRAGAATAGAQLLSRGPLGGAAGAPIASALEEVALARGDGLFFAYDHTTTGPLVSGLADIRDEKRAQTGIGALIDALGSKAVSEAVMSRGLTIKAEATVLERLGDVSRVRIARGDETLSSTFIRLEAGRVAFVSGADAAEGMRRLVSREASDRLSAVPAIVEMASALGPEIVAACVVDAAAIPFAAPRAGEQRTSVWVLGSLERRNDAVVGRVLLEPGAASKLLE